MGDIHALMNRALMYVVPQSVSMLGGAPWHLFPIHFNMCASFNPALDYEQLQPSHVG